MAETAARTTEVALAAILWTIAIALGLIGTIEPAPTLRFWALMAAMPAMLASLHLIARQVAHAERVCIEHLVDGLVLRARERAEDAEVPRIHNRN